MATQSRNELQTRHVGLLSYDPACTADLTPKDHSTQTIFTTEVEHFTFTAISIVKTSYYKPSWI